MAAANHRSTRERIDVYKRLRRRRRKVHIGNENIVVLNESRPIRSCRFRRNYNENTQYVNTDYYSITNGVRSNERRGRKRRRNLNDESSSSSSSSSSTPSSDFENDQSIRNVDKDIKEDLKIELRSMQKKHKNLMPIDFAEKHTENTTLRVRNRNSKCDTVADIKNSKPVEDNAEGFEDSQELAEDLQTLNEIAVLNESNRPIRSCRVRRNYNENAHIINANYYPSTNAVRSKGRRGRKRRTQRNLNNDSSSSSSSSSSTSSSDSENDKTLRTADKDFREELRFERRKMRSMQKGRKNLMPMNFNEKDLEDTTLRTRNKNRKAGNSCADIDPMQLDSNVGFEHVGGLTEHLQSLKEIVVFPLLYPEMFHNFNVQPPKGVLFYGPPGNFFFKLKILYRHG